MSRLVLRLVPLTTASERWSSAGGHAASAMQHCNVLKVAQDKENTLGLD